MLEYQEIQTAAHALHLTNRADSTALWAVVDAIYKQARRDSNDRLKDGELERIQVVLSSEEIYFGTERIRLLHRLGEWANTPVSRNRGDVLRNFKYTYSVEALHAGLTAEQAVEKLLSREKWTTVKSFKEAIRTPVPESKPEPVKVPEPEAEPELPYAKRIGVRVVPKPEQELTEEYCKQMIRAFLPNVSEEVINQTYLRLTMNPKDLRSEWQKYVYGNQEAIDHAKILARALDGAALWLKQKNTTLVQKHQFLEKFQELQPVSSVDIVILAGGLSDEEIETAVSKFQAES